jgi:Flp pilus assembly protein TadD
MFEGSMSFGSGDAHNEAALKLLEGIPLDSAPLTYQHRIRLDLSRSHLSMGQGDEALRLIEPLAQELSSDAEVQASFGIALLSLGRVEQSLGPLQKARALDPNQAERHLVLGTAHMLLGNLDAAEGAFRGALDAASHDGSIGIGKSDLLARIYGDLGALRLLKGDADGGRTFLQRAAGLAPRKATYLANLSYAELLLDHPQEAENLALRATHIDESLVSAWLNLGLAQARLKKWDQARQSFTLAQKLDPEDPRPKNNLADLDELAGSESSPKSN